jgi:uncharacterized membrane protein
VLVLVGAVLGLVFAGISTYDFVQHLDRQVHSIHCSFIPGLGKEVGESGCQVAMMSPYSSVLRTKVWGGIPISLPAMAVFAFLVLYAIDLALARRQDDKRATAFLALATCLPAAASITMLVISLTKLGTTCKLCVGIYLASAACLIGAIVTWRRAAGTSTTTAPAPAPRPKRTPKAERPDEPAFTGGSSALPRAASEPPRERLVASVEVPPASSAFLAGAFLLGVAFVALPVLVYLAKAPDHAKYIGTCDALVKPDDTYGVMVKVTTDKAPAGSAKVIEILDPLCPACRAFEQRLAASGFLPDLDRSAILFPLDNTCNWMVTEATHPGACAVSEAVLCAAAKDPNSAPDVIAWAFAEQERIIAATKADPAAAERLARERFPQLGSCIGSAEAKSRLNKSLRWAVANNIRVLTPQVFIDNVKLCDEDVDLGLEYTLDKMIDRHVAGTLSPIPVEAPAKPGDKPADDKSKRDDKAKSDKPKSDRSDNSDKSDKKDKSSDRSDKTSSDNSDKPADKSSDKPVDKSSDKPVTSPSDKPADKPVTSPSDKPVDKPVTSPPDKPAEKPADKPAEKPADKPDKPVEGGAP